MSRWPRSLMPVVLPALLLAAALPVTGSPARPAGGAPAAAPSPRTAGEPAAPPGWSAPVAAVETERVVQPGDSFWSIAESVVAGPGGTAPPAVIVPYWRQLIAANRDRLVHPCNPDLIFPGQVFVLPGTSPPPPPPGTPPGEGPEDPDQPPPDDPEDPGTPPTTDDPDEPGNPSTTDDPDEPGNPPTTDDEPPEDPTTRPRPPEPPTGESLKVITYNVAGAVRDEWPKFLTINPDGYSFTEVVAQRVAEAQADVVVLQEACESQVEMLRRHLRDLGYPMNLPVKPWERGIEDRCPPVLPDPPAGFENLFGGAILTRGSATPMQPPRNVPAAGCVRTAGPPSVRVCTFHTDPDRPDVDFAAAARQLSPWVAAEPVVLAGDLNTEPESSHMLQLYSTELGALGSFYEADMCRDDDPNCLSPETGGDGTSGSSKIDYILADHNHFARAMTGQVTAPTCPTPDGNLMQCSDHNMLLGEVFFRSSPFEREFPQDVLPVAGTPAWGLYVAIADSFDAPEITAAEEAVEESGYQAGVADLACDQGAAQALGANPQSSTVAVYFASETDAALAARAFESRGQPVAGFANVTPFCLD
jgi:endonuclease/exonuclease/phosphatase family metal-dependent hydrolase